jgi:hypothetical protein
MKFQGQPVNPATAAKFDPSTPQVGTPTTAAATPSGAATGTTDTAPAATGTTDPAPATQGFWKGAGNLAKKAGSAAPGFVKGIGNIASQALGGITQTVGAAAGGFGKGYHTARSGQKFGSKGYGGDTYKGDRYQSSNYNAPQQQGSSQELAQLKQQLANIDQRLRKGNLESKKIKSTPLKESVDKIIIDAEFDEITDFKNTIKRFDRKI